MLIFSRAYSKYQTSNKIQSILFYSGWGMGHTHISIYVDKGVCMCMCVYYIQ